MLDISRLKVGDRVVTAREIDRFPHFTVPAGRTGVVEHTDGADGNGLAVTLDLYVPGAEEWCNAIQWSDGIDLAYAAEDLSLGSGPGSAIPLTAAQADALARYIERAGIEPAYQAHVQLESLADGSLRVSQGDDGARFASDGSEVSYFEEGSIR